MKAVVVYESMYGNTHQVALQVAAGLRKEGAHVDVLPVRSVTPDVVRDSDRIVPIDAAGRRMSSYVKDCRFVEVAGAPHGMLWTHGAEVNETLLPFLAG